MSEYKKQKGQIDDIARPDKSSKKLSSRTEKAWDESLNDMDDIKSSSFKNTAALFGDSRFSGSANSEQKAHILNQLQQSHGNSYVQRLLRFMRVQTKLVVSSPDSIYEKEADRMADVVARELNDQVQRQEEEEVVQGKLQRQVAEEEEEEEIQTKLQRQEEEEEMQAKLQRQEEEEEEMQANLQKQEVGGGEESIATSSSGSQDMKVSDNMENRIESVRGSGHPIPESLRNSLEHKFKHDFGGVKLHIDANSDTLSQELNARAFTIGNDIFFKEGEFKPDSEEGIKLLGHELTHVVQQGAAPVSRQAEEKKQRPKTKEKRK